MRKETREYLNYLKSLSKEELIRLVQEDDRKGNLLIANPDDLTEEEKREREGFIKELESEPLENAISLEEAMEEMYEIVEELGEAYKRENIHGEAVTNVL